MGVCGGKHAPATAATPQTVIKTTEDATVADETKPQEPGTQVSESKEQQQEAPAIQIDVPLSGTGEAPATSGVDPETSAVQIDAPPSAEAPVTSGVDPEASAIQIDAPASTEAPATVGVDVVALESPATVGVDLAPEVVDVATAQASATVGVDDGQDVPVRAEVDTALAGDMEAVASVSTAASIEEAIKNAPQDKKDEMQKFEPVVEVTEKLPFTSMFKCW